MTTLRSLESTNRMRKCSVFTPRGIAAPGEPVHWAPPRLEKGDVGIGKTSGWRQFAADWGMGFIPIIGSIRPPEDYLGVPSADPKDPRFFSYMAPSWVKEVLEKPRTIVLFDEANAGMSARSFAAQLAIMLELRVGEVDLPHGVRVMMCYNPVEQAPGGQDIPMANANRGTHDFVEPPTPEEWGSFMRGRARANGDAKFDPVAEEKRVLAAWPDSYARACGLYTGAVKAHPALLHNIPKRQDPQASLGFPTPRANTFACDLLASSGIHNLSDTERDILIAGTIGDAAAGTLIGYINNADLPDPRDLLTGKVPFKFDKKRVDRNLAMINGCVALVTPENCRDRDELAKGLWSLVLEPVSKKSPDFLLSAIEDLRLANLTGLPEARPVLRTMAPVLRAADYFATETG